MKYNVGDKVRVRADLVRGKKYGADVVTRDMMHMCGKTVTIKEVRDDKYRIEEEEWNWTDEMFEPIPSLKEIKEKKLTCYIHPSTQEEADMLINYLGVSGWSTPSRLKDYWTHYDDGGVYFIYEGTVRACHSRDFYKRYKNKCGDMYEFKEVAQNYKESKSMKFKIGDRVVHGVYGVGTVVCVKSSSIVTYGIRFDNASTYFHTLEGNCDSKYGWWCSEESLKKANEHLDLPFELVTPIEDKAVKQALIQSFDVTNNGRLLFDSWVATRELIRDLDNYFGIHKKTKENNQMKFTFYTTKGDRIDKTCNKKVETITTYAYSLYGVASTTCDKVDYDMYTGALVASAKIMSTKSEGVRLMYNIAIDTWGTEMSNIILKNLANRAFGGSFDRVYDKWRKAVTSQEKVECKCAICGKTFDSADEARVCEKAHADRKKQKREAYLIRKEAKRRLAEKNREFAIQEEMSKISEANGDNT